MRRPAILKMFSGRKERSEESELRTYLETYRSLLTTQLDVRRFAEAVEELRDRNDPRVRASKRNELAYVYLYFSRLVRGEVEGGAEIEGIDRIFFLPLDPNDRIAFVSHRKMDEEEPAAERDQTVFEFFQLPAKDRGWVGAGPAGSDVDAASLDLDEVDRLFPGLLAVIETEVGRPSGSLLIIRQTVPDTPACLLVITSLRGGSGAEKSFGEDDEKDLSALTRMFFQTYRSVRLASFTEAYRELVNDNLILPTQWNEIEATDKENRIDAPEGMSIRSFAQFLCFFCDSLSRADVLPEMDNAFFFPLNSQVYYLYHNVAPTVRPKQNARLLVGHLKIEDEERREVFQRIRLHLAGPKPQAQQETREDRCRRMYADALKLLHTAASPDASSEELQKNLDCVEKRIASHLMALGQQASPLITAIEVALFGTVHWDEWGLDKMDERFLTYQGMASAPADESGLFGHTGSLLAITILVDHLPLGILFINSFLSGAFGEEDQRDIQAISRGYFQTFQTRMLADIVSEYQKLGSSLSVSALKREKSLIPEQKDVREPLALYFDRMFSGFEDLEVGAFLAVDRDRLSVYQRSVGGGVVGRRVELRSELENLNTGALGDVLTREIRKAPTDGTTGPMGWFYRWALLRSLAPEHEVLAAYPLNDIPVRLFQAEEYVQSSSEPKLRSVLESACFEASILDEDFPFLRQLLRQVTGADLLRSHTGSVIALALFYDALPAGLVLLCSSSFLAFTSRIEERDASMATRAFFLPLQMEAREEVIHAYQNILGEGSGQHQEFFDLTRDFLIAMAESLPTMQAGLFFSLDRDILVSVTVGPDRVPVAERWTGRALQDFGQASDLLEDELEGKIEKIESRARGLESPAEKGDPKAQSELRDADVLHLYLRGVLDLFQGSRNPKQYDLGCLVERIFDRTLPAELKDVQRPDVNSGLRSHIHVRAWSKCRFRETFSYLHRLFALEERDPMARRAAEIYEQHWKGVGALLAVLVLQEGLPMGIALLASPIEGSFTEHERIDVDRSARAFFSEGQVHLRDEIILAYRNIVRGMLSEAGAEDHIKKLKDRNEKLRAALEEELAGYLAVFMDAMFETFRADPPSTIMFLPFTDRTLYVGLTGEGSMSSLTRLEKASIEELEPGLPAETTWKGFIGDWMHDLYRDIQAQKPDLLSEPPHSPPEILSALQKDTDTALATFIFSGHRYDDPLQEGHRHAYLAPFRKILVGEASEREAGSLLMTALLYDNLPAAGLLVIHSPIPWRFTEQDRLDVESVSRAFFLTYRSTILRREAARAARLKGMQDMLLGVTHRLKNDLDPTLGVIDDLKRTLRTEGPEAAAVWMQELQRTGQLEAGELGVRQVRKRFELLRSVISESAHIRRSRSLRAVGEEFGGYVEDYKRRVRLRQDFYKTEKIRVRFNEEDFDLLTTLGIERNRLITDLEGTWIDVSNGFEEVLAIYAENAVKAIGDPASKTDSIFLWCLHSSESADRIDLLFFDRIEIETEKMDYIQRGEVIPLEHGGGSGTGFYNARNLLVLNRDGKQRIQSGPAIGGTAIWLTVDRLRVTRVEVSSEEIADDIDRWRAVLMEKTDGNGMEWGRPNRLAPSRQVFLYDGSYRWSGELFSIIWQIFVQRLQILQDPRKRQDLVLPYVVEVEVREHSDSGIVVEFRDNTQSGFTFDYPGKRNEKLEKKKRDQFERNHNKPSKAGPSGAVGSWFFAMQERLAWHAGIELSFGKSADGYTAITLRVPTAS